MSNSELATFTASIDAAWEDLHSFLAAVTPSQAAKRDPAGWSVKDHIAHLAVWEDSVAILFRGGHRHEALGIEELVYAAGSFEMGCSSSPSALTFTFHQHLMAMTDQIERSRIILGEP